jgi:uncharacterized protein (TIGR02246 family)
MRFLRLAVVVIMMMGVAPVTLAQASTVSAEDQKGIDVTLNAFGTTLTAMDFDSFATLFTDDCDFVNIVGMHWSGKAQVVKAHRVVFTTRYRGVPQHVIEKSEATLAPGLVLVTSTILMDDYTSKEGKLMTNNLFRMTILMKKQGDRWLIRSAQNTVIDAEAAKHDPGK